MGVWEWVRGRDGGVYWGTREYVIFWMYFFPWPRLITTLTEKFETRDLKWAPDGKGLILMDKDVFCCAFEVEEEEPPAEA